jgi:hypothetical protein
MSLFFDVVMITTKDFGTPHAEALIAANPGVKFHIHAVADSYGEAWRSAWRNSDRNVREWWRENRASVENDNVLFLDGDVFCNVALDTIFKPEDGKAGIVAASVKSQVRDGRKWNGFSELARLPRELRDAAIGIEPLAVMLMSRAALDAALGEEFDTLFAADFLSEFRLPTVVRFCGYEVLASDRMPRIGALPLTIQPWEIGFFHPVKKEVGCE